MSLSPACNVLLHLYSDRVVFVFVTHLSVSETGHLKAANGVQRSDLPPVDASIKEKKDNLSPKHFISVIYSDKKYIVCALLQDICT